MPLGPGDRESWEEGRATSLTTVPDNSDETILLARSALFPALAC
jgi:hypothetical protein